MTTGSQLAVIGDFANALANPVGGMSDDDLRRLANECHAGYLRTRRLAIHLYVLPAGRALEEMRQRVRREKRTTNGANGRRDYWSQWLRENFVGKPATDRLYRGIARNWEQIVAAGLDREEVSLRRMRDYITSLNRRAREGHETPTTAGGRTRVANNDTPGAPAPAVGRRMADHPAQFAVMFEYRQRAQMKRMLSGLQVKLATRTEADTVLAAVQFAHDQLCPEVK